MSQDLINAIIEMREDDAATLTIQLLDNGLSPTELLDSCNRALDIIGKRFETGEAFLPELIMTGEIMTAISDVIKPRMAEKVEDTKQGKIIIGTVKGDIHDIGKNIVAFMLDVKGFDVIDLGVDVPSSHFIEAVQEYATDIVALSGLLTLAFDSMKEIITDLRTAKPEIKIMIGGAQVTETVCEYTGADAWGANALDAIKLASEWSDGNNG